MAAVTRSFDKKKMTVRREFGIKSVADIQTEININVRIELPKDDRNFPAGCVQGFAVIENLEVPAVGPGHNWLGDLRMDVQESVKKRIRPFCKNVDVYIYPTPRIDFPECKVTYVSRKNPGGIPIQGQEVHGQLYFGVTRPLDAGGDRFVLTFPLSVKEPLTPLKPDNYGLVERHIRLMSDVILVGSDGGEVRCVKEVLTAHSEVFERMLNSTGMTECEDGVVRIKDFASKSLASLWHFVMWGGTDGWEGSPQSSVEMLLLGDRYQVRPLMSLASKVLMKKITSSTVLPILSIAHAVRSWELRDKAIRFVITSTNIPSKELMKLNKEIQELIMARSLVYLRL